MQNNQKPCYFCEKWDWGEAKADLISGKYPHIHIAGASYRYPIEEQFNYCPVCGRPNPKK